MEKNELKERKIFQFKVTLKDSYPPIWRRILVHSKISFEKFHYILQLVMGWDNDHAYLFTIDGEEIINPEGAKPSILLEKRTSTEEVYLYERLEEEGSSFEYVYDLGDYWVHEIQLEKILPFNENQFLPFCIGGELSCPPEDCGGIYQFYHLLERVNGYNEEEKNNDDDFWEIWGWLKDFDTKVFNKDTVNRYIGARKYNGEFDEGILKRYLSCIYDDQTLKMIFTSTQIYDNSENRKKFIQLIFSDKSVILDMEKDKIYSKYYLLSQIKIRIQPSPIEIDNGILIMGDYLIPFPEKDFAIYGMKFLFHYKPLSHKDMTFQWHEMERFFILINSQAIPGKKSAAIPKPDQKISIKVLDMKEFYQHTRFRPGDYILLNPEDIYNNTFSLKYLSAAKVKKKQKKNQQSDRVFLDSLRTVLSTNIPFVSISQQLYYTLYEIFKQDFETWDAPLSSFAQLISDADDIVIYSSEEGEKLLRLK